MAPAVKMPSMPRLRTPARSQINSPSVPKMSGVTMRSAAAQNAAVKKKSSASGMAGSRQTEAVAGDHAGKKNGQTSSGDNQEGEVAGDIHRPAHGIGAHDNGDDKQ